LWRTRERSTPVIRYALVGQSAANSQAALNCLSQRSSEAWVAPVINLRNHTVCDNASRDGAATFALTASHLSQTAMTVLRSDPLLELI
jgi:hypothetical protein